MTAILAAGASLLGGILGRNSERNAIAAQNAYNDPANIRERAERAGLNPLLFFGPGVGNQTTAGGSNYMGQAIAEAGLMAAEALSKRKAEMKLSKAMNDNAELRQQLTQATIRPKVGGIYAQTEVVPSRSVALGGGNASDGVVPRGGLSYGAAGRLTENPWNSDWGLKKTDPTQELGYGVIDNPALGRPFRYPSVNGEMLDFWQLPVLAGSLAYENLPDAERAARLSADDMSREQDDERWRKEGVRYRAGASGFIIPGRDRRSGRGQGYFVFPGSNLAYDWVQTLRGVERPLRANPYK